jgi:hypothetical protein
MTDHQGCCEGCPVLRQAAVVERLARHGMVLGGGRFGKEASCEAIVIATLRDEYGCRGPRSGSCPWNHVFHGLELSPREDVPLLKRKGDGRPGDPGQFL